MTWNSQVKSGYGNEIFFTGQKLTDSLSQPNCMLYVPWYPSCWLHDRVLQLIQKKMQKLVICQVNKVESTQQEFSRQDWACTRTSVVAHGKDKQDLLLLTPGAIRKSSNILSKSHHSLLLACSQSKCRKRKPTKINNQNPLATQDSQQQCILKKFMAHFLKTWTSEVSFRKCAFIERGAQNKSFRYKLT